MITDNMIRYIYIYYKETENQRRVGGRGAGGKNHQHEKILHQFGVRLRGKQNGQQAKLTSEKKLLP